MTEVSTGYIPRPEQLELHKDRKRYTVAVCHRRWGKTNYALIELIRGALEINKSRFAYIAPTYKQAKTISWDILKGYTNMFPGVKFNESELRVDFINGSRITLYGADNPDSLRGIALWGVVFDEYSQQPANIYTEIIRPALSDHKGWGIWIGTPKGKNAFYDMYKYAQNNENWRAYLSKASESSIIDPEELEDARRIMTGDEFNQEYECSFDAAIKGAYYSAELNKTYEDKRVIKGLYDKLLPVYTFWDLGISDYMSIVFAQFHGQEIRIIDYYENNNLGLDHYAKVLREKDYYYKEHWFPHDIEIRELSTGASRLETVQKLFGANTCMIGKRLPVMEGIGAARLLFYKIWFDDDLTEGFRNSLAQYSQEWDEKKGCFRDKPKHDWSSHAADAFRYLALAHNQIMNNDRYNGAVVQGSYDFGI